MTVTVLPPAACVPPAPDLVSWWPAEGTTADRADGNDGAPLNGVSAAKGRVGNAFLFDGVDDVVEVPDRANQTPAGGLTVEAWVLPRALTGARTILSKAGNAGADASWSLMVQETPTAGLELCVYADGTAATARCARTTTLPLTVGTWRHVAATFDAASQTLQIYVDGSAVATTLTAANPVIQVFDGAAPLRIGASVNALGQPAAAWSGLIDEAALYARALTADELRAIVEAGATGRCVTTYSRADAGPDQAVSRGTTVTLDGTASKAFDGAPLTFAWTLTSVPPGSNATLTNPAASQPTFVADLAGTYTAQLVVTNAGRASAPDKVTLSAANRPPSIYPIPPPSAVPGEPFVFDVDATDPDGDPLTSRSSRPRRAWSSTRSRASSPGRQPRHSSARRPSSSAWSTPGGLAAEQAFIVHVSLEPPPTLESILVTPATPRSSPARPRHSSPPASSPTARARSSRPGHLAEQHPVVASIDTTGRRRRRRRGRDDPATKGGISGVATLTVGAACPTARRRRSPDHLAGGRRQRHRARCR